MLLELKVFDSISRYVVRSRALWAAFGVCVLLLLGFYLARFWVGGVLLYKVSDPGVLLAMFAEFSPHQLWVHIVATVGLDVVFPLAYSVLFSGLIIRGFGSYSPAVLVPLAVLVGFDLLENVPQALLLLTLVDATLGALEIIAVFKAQVTPIKFSMLYLTSAITVMAVASIGVQKLLLLRRIGRAKRPQK